ncbi:ADP-ribosylglycohydrolase family protein [Hymenobacter sp. M29]|uniref:ADP-ribosylglycohydrolase family protein n=1 Tax=Hymenobacter mellowenesis TaxID=3063995 RepID=A0ABT9AK34_9BACT|nr:ADP-ribosylglycohydrolase family protein [Hymenobacter sp. M29]MDO7849575.1 ADP-ribosylglycohydrolase family protein [Hymenobacter sp. M29]
MNVIDSYRSVLLGHAVADSIGVPVEFEEREERQRDPVIGIRGYGTFNQKPGTWSDDFSMTACLAESLIASGTERIDTADLSQRFIQWLNFSYWAAELYLMSESPHERRLSGLSWAAHRSRLVAVENMIMATGR